MGWGDFSHMVKGMALVCAILFMTAPWWPWMKWIAP